MLLARLTVVVACFLFNYLNFGSNYRVGSVLNEDLSIDTLLDVLIIGSFEDFCYE